MLPTAIHDTKTNLSMLLFLQTSPFANIRFSMLKTLSLAAGGQVDSIFRFSNTGTEPVPYPGLGSLIWILFVAFVAILFLNFLVSSSKF